MLARGYRSRMTSTESTTDTTDGTDVLDRIRHARDRALEAEETERQRVADAENVDVERAASVRLATRQAVREALDDVLGETSQPRKAVQGEGAAEG